LLSGLTSSQYLYFAIIMMVVMKSLLVLVSMLFGSSFAYAQINSPDQHEQQAGEITWMKVETGQPNVVGFFQFVQDSIIRAVTANSFLRSSDSGNSWLVSSGIFGDDSSNSCSQFLTDSIGYVSTSLSARLFKTTDAGTSWTSKHTEMSNRLTGFFMFDTTNGIAWNGVQTAQTQDAGRTWLVRDHSDFNHAVFSDRLHGFLVGPAHPWDDGMGGRPEAAHFERTIDAGRSWTEINPKWNDDWIDIAALDSMNLVVSGGTAIYWSSNAGDSWQVAQGVEGVTLKLDFPTRSIGYTVGRNGIILRSEDGGRTWVRLPSPTENHLVTLGFKDSLTGFISGTGIVYRTTTGGKSWVQHSVSSITTDLKLWPNPTQGSTRVEFLLPKPERITLAIYDMTGKVVSTPIANEMRGEGSNVIHIATDQLRSGTYRLVLTGDESRGEAQLTIVR
jgi:photosystem II stability/assembly factor-like uncharacterized protein